MRFSTGTECFAEISASPARAACSRVAAAGSRSAQRLRRGRPVAGCCAAAARPRARAAAGERAEPGGDQLAVGPAAEDRQPAARPRSPGRPGRRRPSPRRAAPGRERTSRGGPSRRGPATARAACQCPAAAQPVHAGGAPPRVGSGAGGPAAARIASNSCRGPLGLALLLEDRGERVAQVDQHLDVQRRVDQPLLGQRPGAPVGRRVALLAARSRAATRPGRRGRPAAARPAGRRARCRRSAGTRPISARQGRSWLAACSTHSGVGDRVLDHRQVRQGRGRSARCRSRCGASAPGRRAARSGSRRRARRRRRPGRCRRAAPRRTRPAGSRSR